MNDSLQSSDEEANIQAETQRIEAARQDPRMTKLRESTLAAIHLAIERWSTDAGISDVRALFMFLMSLA
jgi:hypothetical protein